MLEACFFTEYVSIVTICLPPQKSDRAWEQAELTSAASSEPERLTQSSRVQLVMFERSLIKIDQLEQEAD